MFNINSGLYNGFTILNYLRKMESHLDRKDLSKFTVNVGIYTNGNRQEGLRFTVYKDSHSLESKAWTVCEHHRSDAILVNVVDGAVGIINGGMVRCNQMEDSGDSFSTDCGNHYKAAKKIFKQICDYIDIDLSILGWDTCKITGVNHGQ